MVIFFSVYFFSALLWVIINHSQALVSYLNEQHAGCSSETLKGFIYE